MLSYLLGTSIFFNLIDRVEIVTTKIIVAIIRFFMIIHTFPIAFEYS